MQIRELTKQGSQLQALKVTILAGWPDTKDETPTYQRILVMQRQLTVHNGVIFRGKHVIIPNVLQPEMLTRIHASHLGAEACFCKVRDVISWPTMKPEVKDFVSNCIACNDYLQNSSKKPLISHPISSKPWSQKIATDIITVFCRNYLITVDFTPTSGNQTHCQAIQQLQV